METLTQTPDIHPDKIFVPGHLTDLEKLLFAQAYIKELKKENSALSIELGKLRSFIQEQKEVMNLEKGELKKLRAISYNQQLLDDNAKIKRENKRLKKDNKDLITKLCAKQLP